MLARPAMSEVKVVLMEFQVTAQHAIAQFAGLSPTTKILSLELAPRIFLPSLLNSRAKPFLTALCVYTLYIKIKSQ